MEWHVWSLKHVTRQHRDVIVILLSWNRFSNRVTDELKKHTKEFGALMSYRGVLVMPYEERMRESLSEVLEKPWPSSLAENIKREPYPFLLIIDKDFEEFDPNEDKVGFIWFSDFKDNEEPIWQVLDCIARKVDAGDDLFAYLDLVHKKSRSKKLRDKLAKLAKYVEVKIPVVPGVVSVNAGAIWADTVSM